MKKSQKIREHVTANPGADIDAIENGTGLARKLIQTILAQRVKAGEFSKNSEGGYTIDPGYTRGAKKPGKKRKAAKPARRAKRKSARTPRAAKPRSYRDIKVAPAKNGNGTLRQALIENYQEASSKLRAGLIDEVAGWEDNPLLKHLVDSHKAAEHLLGLTA